MIGIVVVDLIRLHEHLLLIARLIPLDSDRGFWLRRRGQRETLGESRRARNQVATSQHGEDANYRCEATAMRPGHWWTSANRPRHHPSSWYSNAIKPVRPAASTGSHAAAAGCISSALVKSSVTFDKT